MAALLVVVGALVGGTGQAQAYSVNIAGCGPQPNHVWGFVYFGGNPANFNDGCGGGSGRLLAQSSGEPGGYGKGFALYTPPGTYLNAGVVHIGILPYDGSDGRAFIVEGTDTSYRHQKPFACGYGAPFSCTADSDVYIPGPLIHVRLLDYCGRPGYCGGYPYPNDLTLTAYSLNVEDDNPARVTARSGPVWAPGWHRASDRLGGVVDNGAEGIAGVAASLDGVTTTVNPGCDYTAMRVCPGATLNTLLNGATDGDHHLVIGARTASGIQTVLYDNPHYLVDSTPPTAPAAVALDSPGSRYSPAASRTIGWVNPGGQVAPITHAVFHVCRVDNGQCRDQTADGFNVSQGTVTPWGGGGAYQVTVVLQDAAGNINDGPGGRSAPVTLRYDQRAYSVLYASASPVRSACRAGGPGRPRRGAHHARARRQPPRRLCHVVGPRVRRVVRVRFGHHSMVYGVLVDTAGHPLAGAPIEVDQQIRGPGQTFTVVGSTSTDAAGQFKYRVAPGPSRTLRLVYPGTDALKTAIADINIRVPAFSTFDVDRHTAHLNQPIVFSGQVKGAPIPKDGLAVQLEGRDYRTGWIPVSPAGKLHTDRAGRWRYAFAAQRQSSPRFTYPFRLAILADPVYPYLPAVTKPRLVTIFKP